MEMLLTLLVHQEPKSEVSIPMREWAESDVCPCAKILAQSYCPLHFGDLDMTNGDSLGIPEYQPVNQDA